MRSGQAAFAHLLRRYYSFYTVVFIAFVLAVGALESAGVPARILGYLFLAATFALYAGIGFMSRTADVNEYYVAGRRVPALFNGMATGADWMSAASYIGLAGTLYHAGYDGLAFVMGWTGGYCLVALLLAPYLRKFGQFTIPDFLGARYGGNATRLIGAFATILCSFTYVVAQIYGVGLITSRLTGLEFTLGIFLGLAGILFCSFLGGMKAVTWTQVAQYIILILAYSLPIVWLSVKYTGNPLPQIAYGQQLQKIAAHEQAFNDGGSAAGAAEESVRRIFRDQAAALDADLQALETDGTAFLAAGKAKLLARVDELRYAVADARAIDAAARAAANYPSDVATARQQWTAARDAARARAAPVKPHAEAFPAADERARDIARRNFLALVLCLMVGTAALPHILIRFYTTPSVRQARTSVFWSLLFILLLYSLAPALAVLVKYEIYANLVGSPFSVLPAWVAHWASVDKTLMAITDINHDGIVQLAEIALGSDLLVLATPEIAGLPYVVSGLVAAGGLAAALSTADGLLLTVANALSHDVYYRVIEPTSSTARRILVSKSLLIVVALFAAWVTALKPGNILFLVGAAFSLAASAFFPALVCGIFWKRANRTGAIVGMIAGLGICIFYMVMTYPFFGINAPKWWDIEPIAGGLFGIPAGFVGLVIGSLLTPPPPPAVQELVNHVRYPRLDGDAAVPRG